MTQTVLITGTGGLVGSEAVRHFVEAGWDVVGIDNDMRAKFFGQEASTWHTSLELASRYHRSFKWYQKDIRDPAQVDVIVGQHKPDLIVHAAAQPAHDWAATDPKTDFFVNAVGTLNMLEAARRSVPDSTFVYCSTSKVYGDNPNRLPLVDLGIRLDLLEGDEYYNGIDTTMSVDLCTHSLFGVSKLSADLMVQEYGRYFKMPTVCFRPGCISGGAHQGAKLHGFLSYLMRCAMTDEQYTIIGYHGKQVRCNIHARDLVEAFETFHQAPLPGAVYNIGAGREGSCSVLEAVNVCNSITGGDMSWIYEDTARIGDHRWWISDNAAFRKDYPEWEPYRSSPWTILQEIYDNNERWLEEQEAA